jgi:hypothetical protein
VGYTSGSIVRFTPADQAAGGEIAGPLDLVPAGGASLTSLAFDETGGLWYPVGLGQIARIPAASLGGASGSVSLIFDPAPVGTPINDGTP